MLDFFDKTQKNLACELFVSFICVINNAIPVAPSAKSLKATNPINSYFLN